MDTFLLSSITEKLNLQQANLNNMLETTQNLITSGAESGDILAFDGTNWRASGGAAGPQGPAGADGADGADGGGSTAIYARQHWPGTHVLGTSTTLHEWSNIISSDYSVIDFQSTPAIVYSNATASGGQARNGMFKVPTGHAGVYNIRLSGCFNIPHRTVNFEIRKNTSTIICDANHALAASGLDDGDHTSLYQLYTLADLAEGDEISARVSASPATGNTWSGGVRMLGDTKRNFFEIFKVS